VFGQADQKSLEVVRKIGQVNVGPGDRPVKEVVIEKATVEFSEA
jgi:hypothetical protein